MTKGIWFLSIFALLVLLANIFIPISDNLWPIKLQLSSLLSGDLYQGQLGLYRYYLEHNNIPAAKAMENKIAPDDTQRLKELYYPDIIAKKVNELQFKKDKTIQDWIALAQYQIRLNLTAQAKTSLQAAAKLDPINDSLQKLSLLLN